MELLITLSNEVLQWPILIALIIIGFVVNMFDKKIDSRINFKYSQFRQ